MEQALPNVWSTMSRRRCRPICVHSLRFSRMPFLSILSLDSSDLKIQFLSISIWFIDAIYRFMTVSHVCYSVYIQFCSYVTVFLQSRFTAIYWFRTPCTTRYSIYDPGVLYFTVFRIVYAVLYRFFLQYMFTVLYGFRTPKLLYCTMFTNPTYCTLHCLGPSVLVLYHFFTNPYYCTLQFFFRTQRSCTLPCLRSRCRVRYSF